MGLARHSPRAPPLPDRQRAPHGPGRRRRPGQRAARPRSRRAADQGRSEGPPGPPHRPAHREQAHRGPLQPAHGVPRRGHGGDGPLPHLHPRGLDPGPRGPAGNAHRHRGSPLRQGFRRRHQPGGPARQRGRRLDPGRAHRRREPLRGRGRSPGHRGPAPGHLGVLPRPVHPHAPRAPLGRAVQPAGGGRPPHHDRLDHPGREPPGAGDAPGRIRHPLPQAPHVRRGEGGLHGQRPGPAQGHGPGRGGDAGRGPAGLPEPHRQAPGPGRPEPGHGRDGIRLRGGRPARGRPPLRPPRRPPHDRGVHAAGQRGRGHLLHPPEDPHHLPGARRARPPQAGGLQGGGRGLRAAAPL